MYDNSRTTTIASLFCLLLTSLSLLALPQGQAGATPSDKIAQMTRAANAGDSNAMVQLGWCYQNGIGVARDQAQAASWFRKGADAGSADAMNRLGLMIVFDQVPGVDKDEALTWFTKSGGLGNARGMALRGYFYMYCNQFVGTKHPQCPLYGPAMGNSQQAASKGDALGALNVALLYDLGLVPWIGRDAASARPYYTQAAKSDEPEIAEAAKHGLKQLDEERSKSDLMTAAVLGVIGLIALNSSSSPSHKETGPDPLDTLMEQQRRERQRQHDECMTRIWGAKDPMAVWASCP